MLEMGCILDIHILMKKYTQGFSMVVLVVIIALALGGIGWYLYTQKNSSQVEHFTAQQEILSASFVCEDNSHFIAEFPSPQEVRIMVDGNLLRTLPLVAGDGQRYEDSSYVYVFAWDEANVTTKGNRKTTLCSQPVDPNKAPVNFGDAGEGGGAQGGYQD